MDVINNRLIRDAVPVFNVMAAIVIALGLGAILMLAKDVIIPLALAVLLSFALAPIASLLQHIGLTRGVAVIGAVLAGLVIVSAVFLTTYWQFSDLVEQLPTYQSTIRSKLSAIAGGGTETKFGRAGRIVADIVQDVQPKAPAGEKPSTVVVKAEEKGGIALALEYLSHVGHPVAVFAIVFLLTAFMLVQREDLRNRLIRLMGTDDLQKTTAALDDAGKRVGRMLLMQVMINATFGVVIGVGLWLIGVPSPFLWGVLAGVLRFVPYIGAVMGLLPPLLVAFAVDPTWTKFFWTIGLFAAVDPLVGHVLEPLLYGRSSGLSPIAVVISATVWAFLWGPIGLVLSTPLTICLVVIGRHVKRLEFLDILLGDRPVLAPHEIFYQRMLAGDPREAIDQARDFLKGRALSTYYDEVALAALRRAHLDIVRGDVKGQRLQTLVECTNDLVRSLGKVAEGQRGFSRYGAEAEAAFEQVRPDRLSAREVLRRDDFAEGWTGAAPVAIIYGSHPLDEAAASMLGQVLERHGVNVLVAPIAAAAKASDEQIDQLALVCLSFIEPQSTLHLRAASIDVHRRRPSARVMLCIWQDTDQTLLATLTRRLRVDRIVTNVSDALEVVVAMGRRKLAPQPVRSAPPVRRGGPVDSSAA